MGDDDSWDYIIVMPLRKGKIDHVMMFQATFVNISSNG